MPEFPKEMFAEAANRRVSLSLLLQEVVNKEDMKADADAVRSRIETMAAAYEKPEDVVNYYYGNEEQLAQVESFVLEEQIVQKLLDEAKVSEKTVSFDEVMNEQTRL